MQAGYRVAKCDVARVLRSARRGVAVDELVSAAPRPRYNRPVSRHHVGDRLGQVWRARDTRLYRDVALEILPDAFADDRIVSLG